VNEERPRLTAMSSSAIEEKVMNAVDGWIREYGAATSAMRSD